MNSSGYWCVYIYIFLLSYFNSVYYSLRSDHPCHNNFQTFRRLVTLATARKREAALPGEVGGFRTFRDVRVVGRSTCDDRSWWQGSGRWCLRDSLTLYFRCQRIGGCPSGLLGFSEFRVFVDLQNTWGSTLGRVLCMQ